jgi:prevent-host-death family protein
MMQVNIYEAKTHLFGLLNQVENGEEIIIARAGKPVVRLVPVVHKMGRRIHGMAKRIITVADYFDKPRLMR